MTHHVIFISSPEDLKSAFDIRRQVFVIEQKVEEREEYDEYEEISKHYLAVNELGTAMGTCRWRYTDFGVKLERFAVLSTFRGHGVATSLIRKCIEEIKKDKKYSNQSLYLHAQIQVVGMYEKFGFKKMGQSFWEAGIEHFKMILN